MTEEKREEKTIDVQENSKTCDKNTLKQGYIVKFCDSDPDYPQLEQSCKNALTDIFKRFATSEDGTMSVKDLTNYIIYCTDETAATLSRVIRICTEFGISETKLHLEGFHEFYIDAIIKRPLHVWHDLEMCGYTIHQYKLVRKDTLPKDDQRSYCQEKHQYSLGSLRYMELLTTSSNGVKLRFTHGYPKSRKFLNEAINDLLSFKNDPKLSDSIERKFDSLKETSSQLNDKNLIRLKVYLQFKRITLLDVLTDNDQRDTICKDYFVHINEKLFELETVKVKAYRRDENRSNNWIKCHKRYKCKIHSRRRCFVDEKLPLFHPTYLLSSVAQASCKHLFDSTRDKMQDNIFWNFSNRGGIIQELDIKEFGSWLRQTYNAPPEIGVAILSFLDTKKIIARVVGHLYLKEGFTFSDVEPWLSLGNDDKWIRDAFHETDVFNFLNDNETKPSSYDYIYLRDTETWTEAKYNTFNLRPFFKDFVEMYDSE